MTATPTGYAAFGQRVPPARKSRALQHLRHMCPNVTLRSAMEMIDAVANAIEHDDPYRALHDATHAPLPIDVNNPDYGHDHTPTTTWALDLTGGYRLLAVLCTHAGNEETR